MEFIIRNLQTCKPQLSFLCIFKTTEITFTVELFPSELGANGSSME